MFFLWSTDTNDLAVSVHDGKRLQPSMDAGNAKEWVEKRKENKGREKLREDVGIPTSFYNVISDKLFLRRV